MARCMLCRKSLLRCECNKAGRRVPANSKRNEKVVRTNGWCSTCSSRVIDGKCMNFNCSSHKK